jgi:chemotaxis signal transduction protein
VLSISPPETARVALVHVADPRVRWSVSAAAVLRILPAAEWPTPLVDVLIGLGAAPAQEEHARRVMIMRGAGDRELAVLAAGAIDIAEVDPIDVLPLPETFARVSPQISAIVAFADHSLSLLLQPSAVLPPDDIVLGE